MSDRITHVEDVTPKGAAYHAALQAGFVHGGGYKRAEAQMIAAAIEAYVRARPIESIRLLRPKPGDVVVFHFAGPMSRQELDGFIEDIKPATQQFHGVKFIAVDGCPEITVVRDEERQEKGSDDGV